ncbi:DUF4145 domain-containing protein [Geothermobacter ehrlichii]|nr:DUF4145 domain-containing protein [Geothermobacter ehrlichii]
MSFELLRQWSSEICDLCSATDDALKSGDAISAAVKMRGIADWVVREAYAAWSLKLPVQQSLFDLVSNTAFRDHLSPLIENKLHRIRKLGNRGAHNEAVPGNDAFKVWNDCLEVVRWFYLNVFVARRLAEGGPIFERPEKESPKCSNPADQTGDTDKVNKTHVDGVGENGEVPMVTFPHANNSSVDVRTFVERWRRKFEEPDSPYRWEEAVPRLNAVVDYQTQLKNGRRYSLDVLCREIVPESYRNTMQATNDFMDINSRALERCIVVNHLTGQRVQGARLTNFAKDFLEVRT